MIKKYLIPAAAVLTGAVGAILRANQLATVFDSSGLPVPGHAVTIVLRAISCAALVLAAAAALRLARKDVKDPAPASPAASVFSAASGLVFALCALTLNDGSGLHMDIFTAFGVLCGLSFALLGVLDFLKKGDVARLVPSFLPSAFFAYWTAIVYTRNWGDPIVLRYSCGCLALGFAAIYFALYSGFVFRRPSPRLTVFSGLAALYFLTVSLADGHTLYENLMIAVSAAQIFLGVASVLASEREPAGETGDIREEE